MTSIESITQTKDGLVQGGVFINNTTCISEMCGHFRCVCESIDYVHCRPHDVVCTQCISTQQFVLVFD